jgi:hypothetical protein
MEGVVDDSVTLCAAVASRDCEILRTVIRNLPTSAAATALTRGAWHAVRMHPYALKQVHVLMQEVQGGVFTQDMFRELVHGDREEDSVLALAAVHGFVGIVRRLIQAGADPCGFCYDLRCSFHRWTCLETAVQTGRPEIVREFLSAVSVARVRDELFWSCVSLACIMGATSVVDELLRWRQGGPGEVSFLHEAVTTAVSHGSTGCLQQLASKWPRDVDRVLQEPGVASVYVGDGRPAVVTVACPTLMDLLEQPLPHLQKTFVLNSGVDSRDRRLALQMHPASQHGLVSRVCDVVTDKILHVRSGEFFLVEVWCHAEDIPVVLAVMNEASEPGPGSPCGRDILVTLAEFELRAFCYSVAAPVKFGRVTCPSFVSPGSMPCATPHCLDLSSDDTLTRHVFVCEEPSVAMDPDAASTLVRAVEGILRELAFRAWGCGRQPAPRLTFGFQGPGMCLVCFDRDLEDRCLATLEHLVPAVGLGCCSRQRT